MANREPAGFLKTSGGVLIEDLTPLAAFETEARPAGYDWLGIYVKVSTLSAGTVGVALEASADEGVTWVAFSEDKNTNVQATLDDFAAPGVEFQFWLNPFPPGCHWTWRVKFTEVVAWGTVVLTAKFFQRNTASEFGV